MIPNFENLSNGDSSMKLNHRPFFSIVIPCYNSKQTIGKLLQSIAAQNMSDDIEVIISDDHSTEDYTDEVEPYLDQLCIKLTETDYNFAPGNTREAGTKLVTGEWLCFADHDDEFIPNKLPGIKAAILDSGEPYCAIANFLEVDTITGRILQEHRKSRNWNHAKFYNVDNLWRPFNIHFKKDLKSHEDIYISSCINCALKQVNDDRPLYIDSFCYKWMARPSSLSRRPYENHTFLEVHFSDYLESTGYVYLEKFMKENLPIDYAVDAVIGVLLLSYFYSESFLVEHPKDYLPETFDYLRDFLIKCKETLYINNEYIYKYASAYEARFYEASRVNAQVSVGSFIPTRTFGQWLDYLHHDLQYTHAMPTGYSATKLS